MTFSETLNALLHRHALSLSRLSQLSGISKASLSRMKNGKLEPSPESDIPRRLAAAFASLAGEGEQAETAEELCAALRATLDPAVPDYPAIAARLNALIEALGINATDLSRYLKFDASYLSRIRSGQRRPANATAFCRGVASFASARSSPQDCAALARLIDCPHFDTLEMSEREEQLFLYLTRYAPPQHGAAGHFLQTLDQFDLRSYLGSTAPPPAPSPTPAELPMTQYIYGLEGFMDAELLWMEAAARWDGGSELLFYSDMPMAEMSRAPDFPQRWMYALSLLLKKGCRLHIIHDIDRPLPEMLLGLEGWIPLYMTGQVSPYSLSGHRDDIFLHFLRLSPSAALSGEAIAGHHAQGRYRFTREARELAYYHARGRALLSHAQPLMEIYRQRSSEDYRRFLRSFADAAGSYRNILSAPPVYTLTRELLEDILRRSGVHGETAQRILRFHGESCAQFARRLPDVSVTDVIPLFYPEDFPGDAPALGLSDLFLDEEIRYTREEYAEHLRLTREAAAAHSHYRCILTPQPPFRHISVRICEGECTLISHGKGSPIHFVIQNPKLRRALEQFVLSASGG